MARFNIDESDNYGVSSGGNVDFFSLKNDGDVARIRFMYNDMRDVEGLSVHKVQIGDKTRYVYCIRESYNSPVDDCPLCAAKSTAIPKFYIPVYDVDEGKVKIWERGKAFVKNKISGICSRYATADTPLVSHQFDVERHGKKGDTNTDYMLYEVSKDDTTLDDLPEIPKILGGIVMEKTADEMNYFIENGEFPASTIQRDSRDNRDTNEDAPRRRTPSTDRRSDAF